MRAIGVRLRLSESTRAVVPKHFAQVLHSIGRFHCGTLGFGAARSGGKERTEFAALRVRSIH